jgi:hypothetical protein
VSHCLHRSITSRPEPHQREGVERGASVEIRAGPVGDARQLGCCRRSPHRVVPRLPPSSRARPRRTGSALRRRDDGARLAETASLLKMRQPRDRYGGYWDRAPGLASASSSFPTILRSGIADRLPLHVRNRVRATTGKRLDVIFPITVTGAGCKPRRRARVLALELPRHFSGSVLFR